MLGNIQFGLDSALLMNTAIAFEMTMKKSVVTGVDLESSLAMVVLAQLLFFLWR